MKTHLRMSSGICALLLLVVALSPAAHGDGAADADIAANAAAARTARQKLDFVQVEQLRIDRLRLADGASPDSIWSKGAAAIREADALFNRLEYGQACDRLRAAWKPFAEAKDGLVFGDVAMKLFEVTQGALVIHPRCLDEGNPDHIATDDELRAAIQLVVDRDPCATEAHAVFQFLERADAREAFTRAEMRPSFRIRNRVLLDNSYGGQGPIMPWHAPVELLKAENQATLLDDLDFCDSLLDRGAIHQIAGWDSRYEPFSLLPNSWLLMRLPNSAGYDVPSLLYLSAAKGNKPEWRSLGLHLLLVQAPGAAIADAGPVTTARAEVRSRLERVEPLVERRVGAFTVKLFDVPADKAERAVEFLPYLFMERWKSLEQDVDEAAKRALKGAAPGVRQSLLLPAREVAFCSGELPRPAAGRFVKGEALWELELQALSVLGAVLVVTQDGRNVVSPPFMTLEDGTQYLPLRDGRRLQVDGSSSRLEIVYSTAKAELPLTFSAVPPFFLPATIEGKQIVDVLQAAGYTSVEAEAELRKVFVDPRHRPGKLTASRTRGRQPQTGADGAKTDELLAALRSQFYGFRYLVDSRGRSITSRQALQATPVALKPQEHPYLMFDTAGREVTDTDTGYTVGDWQFIYGNMIDEFMPKALWLAPSPALWNVYARLLNRMPRIGGVALGAAQTSGQKMTNPWSQPVARPPASPVVVSGTNAPIIPDAGLVARELRPDFWAMNTRAFSPRSVVDSVVVRDTRGNFRPSSRSRYAMGGQQAEPDLGQLATMYYRQAGADAIDGKLHRSLVCYQDVMRQLDSGELDPSFFQSVPNPQSLGTFAVQISDYVVAQERKMVVRMEMAAVLRSAGLVTSAEFLERGVVDRLQLSTLPVIESSIEYANSHGYREPSVVSTVRQRIAAHLALLEKGPQRDTLRHVRQAFASKAFRGDEAMQRRQAIESRLADLPKQKSQDAGDVITQQVRELEAVPRSLPDWLAEKRLFLDKLPQHLVRPSLFPPPGAVCPCVGYDAVAGFEKTLGGLLRRTDSGAVAEWAMLDATRLQSHPDAGRLDFLLGWYWLERKDATLARDAFLAAARAFAAAAGKSDSAESLVAARNTVVMLIAAAGIADLPPGVKDAHEQPLNELVVRMLDWKRKWVALSLPADVADAEFNAVKGAVDMVRIVGQGTEFARTKPRYFFFDYRFEHGPIPDVVVKAAVKARTIPAGGQAPPAVNWPEFFAREFSFPTSPDETVLVLNREKP